MRCAPTSRSLAGFHAYLAGPPAMVDAASELLREKGVGARDIHADAFYSAARPAHEGGRGMSAPFSSAGQGRAGDRRRARHRARHRARSLPRQGAKVVIADAGVSIGGRGRRPGQWREQLAQDLGAVRVHRGHRRAGRGAGRGRPGGRALSARWTSWSTTPRSCAMASSSRPQREDWERVIDDQPHRGLRGAGGGHAGHARAAKSGPRARAHRQHGLHRRAVRQLRPGRLCRGQGRAGRTDARGGDGHGALEGQLQRRRARSRPPA